MLEKIMLVLRWVRDVESGEMIEVPREGYTRHYLAFTRYGRIAQKDLDSLCSAVNSMFSIAGIDSRITNSMGEIIMARRAA